MSQPTPTKKITKELYKKNLDLFNANRTLELLRKLYRIITSTLEVQTLAQDFIDTIVADLGFSSGLVAIKASKTQSLKMIAHTHSKLNSSTIKATGLTAKKLNFPLTNKDNLLVQSFNSLKRTTTVNFLDLWIPLVTPGKLKTPNNQSTLIYPIKFGDKPEGVFAISSPRDVSDLSKSEKDILRRTATVFGIAIDRVRNYQDLQQANVKLRHLDKIKDEFVFIATHELKTPVTVMKGYLSMIDDGTYGKIPAKFKDGLNQLKQANTQLVQLVNDLLQIARAEAKTITIDTQPVEICQAVDKVINSIKTLANQKKLKLEHARTNTTAKAMADPDRLNEILNNLISNAIKYSDSGTISVTHEIKDRTFITHIADQGKGMTKKDQAKIFTRFFRAQETAQAPGTGLGLFIVKQLVEKMGGKIWFKSEFGNGTTFSFSLPLAGKNPNPPKQPKPNPQPKNQPPTNLKKKTPHQKPRANN